MLANRVREYTLTTGTGDITLSGALAAHIRFADAFAVGDTVTYVLEDGDNYEIGTGTLIADTILERTEVGETLVNGVYTKGAAAPIALTGAARVYCAATAEFLLDPVEAADIIREVTPDAGVTVDGVLIKDGSLIADALTAATINLAGALTVAESITRNVADSTVTLSGGTAPNAGGNIVFYGQDHATNANDISFRAGTASIALWDNSENSWDWKSKSITGLQNLVFTGSGGDLFKISGTGDLQMSGGSGQNLGANIILFGESHPTRAKDWMLRANQIETLSYDDSAASLKAGVNVTIDTVQPRLILRDTDQATGSQVVIDAVNGNLILRVDDLNNGGSNFNISKRGVTVLSIDPANIFNFQNNTLTGLRLLHSDVSHDFVAVSGGSAVSLGANILMFGENHATNANDIQFRTGSTTRFHWEQEPELWNFQGSTVAGIGNLSVGGVSDGARFYLQSSSETLGTLKSTSMSGRAMLRFINSSEGGLRLRTH